MRVPAKRHTRESLRSFVVVSFMLKYFNMWSS